MTLLCYILFSKTLETFSKERNPEKIIKYVKFLVLIGGGYLLLSESSSLCDVSSMHKCAKLLWNDLMISSVLSNHRWVFSSQPAPVSLYPNSRSTFPEKLHRSRRGLLTVLISIHFRIDILSNVRFRCWSWKIHISGTGGILCYFLAISSLRDIAAVVGRVGQRLWSWLGGS